MPRRIRGDSYHLLAPNVMQELLSGLDSRSSHCGQLDSCPAKQERLRLPFWTHIAVSRDNFKSLERSLRVSANQTSSITPDHAPGSERRLQQSCLPLSNLGSLRSGLYPLFSQMYGEICCTHGSVLTSAPKPQSSLPKHPADFYPSAPSIEHL